MCIQSESGKIQTSRQQQDRVKTPRTRIEIEKFKSILNCYALDCHGNLPHTIVQWKTTRHQIQQQYNTYLSISTSISIAQHIIAQHSISFSILKYFVTELLRCRFEDQRVSNIRKACPIIPNIHNNKTKRSKAASVVSCCAMHTRIA